MRPTGAFAPDRFCPLRGRILRVCGKRCFARQAARIPLGFNSDSSLEPSFPRKRESSKENIPRSGQDHGFVPLRGAYLINWIPAFAGMTMFMANGFFGFKREKTWRINAVWGRRLTDSLRSKK
jgi:hypothetical protein